ncbi:hypothetical protein [Gillisia sp. Hel_I_29]|uniref:hypothetical protein n=1 Tax=Gillisia sp. Hel_I_29 TaxID=1249975 RepID=UPI0005584810|nr:hypothetical protein [Gillisia sp. Hel_I_29]
MKKITFLLFLLFFNISFCQETKEDVIAKFIIKDASHNGVDVTPQILSENAFVVLYKTDEKVLMANVWSKSNSQSSGRIYNIKQKEIKESLDNYKKEIYNFNWRYINSYDHKKGTAEVKLEKIYKPQGVAFIITIIPEDLDLIIYRGYQEGSIDFSSL